MAEILTGATLGKLLRPGMRVFVQGSVGQPLGLMRLLANLPEVPPGLNFISALTPGFNDFSLGEAHRQSRLTTYFDYRDLRRSWQGGSIDFVPMHYSQIAPSIRDGGRIDLAFIQVAPPDDSGRCSTGFSADFVPDLLTDCDMVIAEINSAYPAMADGPAISLDAIHYRYDSDVPLPELEQPLDNAVAIQIARNAAELVRDGDCIQFGVGRLPQAVVSALTEKNDLGLHNGLTSPPVRALIESGVMTGSRKTIDRGKHITGAIGGTSDFYAWVAGRTDFAFRPVSYTHGISTLAAIDNLAAINAVLEVDLFGQANAEIAGGRQISGTGGLVDFVRGARAARNGRAIICLPATSPDGKRSNIVAALKSAVTIARSDIDYVVTEYGYAALRNLSAAARAEALIAIAAPAFRDLLRDQWTVA